MSSKDIITESARKGKMADKLFWVFVVIFGVTAIFAFLAILIVFDWLPGPRPEGCGNFNKISWALWSFVLAEVAGGVVSLWYYLLGLSRTSNTVDLVNRYEELFKGLVRNEMITKAQEYLLRQEVPDVSGRVAGPVLGKK